MKLQKPNMHSVKIMLCTFKMVKMLKCLKGHYSRKKIQIFFQNLIRLSTHHLLSAYQLSFKAIASTVCEISCLQG